MAKVMLVQPWSYHDEGVTDFNLDWEWRNGPYSLLLLGTQLTANQHEVRIVDMIRDLVVFKGNVGRCLTKLEDEIEEFRPDIIGFGFFSIHYFEVKRAVEVARATCDRIGHDAIFFAGGIHASTEPHATIEELGFDYSFVGEGDLGIVDLANGTRPESVAGVVARATTEVSTGEQVKDLNGLPFPDWTLCDHAFYTHPSFGKIKYKATRSVDMIMGRGCVYKCAFCAYNALSRVRFYSAEYLVEQIEKYHRDYGIDGIYFTDSTIGNNRKLVREFCELMIQRGTAERVEWFANIRPNQVNEKDLKLMWRGGCRFLFYGFESGSQRVLDLMVKNIDLEANYRAAELHNQLGYLYHASMLLGYPGEREEDILQTFEFLEKTQPPIVGVNWYVPLPGSPDYDKLKAEGIIDTEDPEEWRRIGEVNACRVYADVPDERFRELYQQATVLAKQVPERSRAAWGCLAPPQSEMPVSEGSESSGLFDRLGGRIRRLANEFGLRSG